MQALEKLSIELGHPGVDALWIAAKKRKIDVKKQDVREYVAGNGKKQVLGAPQRATGKTVSEDDNRWMADLVDVTNAPAGKWKYFLVCVNVFDRYMYARPLKTKGPVEVSHALQAILRQAREEDRKIPQVIGSDGGSEFKGAVSSALSQMKIIQKFKDAGDINSLGLIDRQIGLLKRKLAEMHVGRQEDSWAANLPSAVNALNSTPKPAALHGAAPKEVRDDPNTTFMLMQDQARAIQHNETAAQRKKAQLLESGTFRPQFALDKFKRNFQATYGDVERVRSVAMGRVTSTTGETHPLKQIKIVQVRQR